MLLKENSYNYSVGNSKFYQFKNKENGFTSVLEISKTKSGYNVEYNGVEDFYKTYSGIRTMKEVKEIIKPFKY